jgi:hypothetical protein
VPTWLLHFLGLDSATGTAYLSWSGFGGDLTEAAVVGALIGLLRKHNCEVARCWRLGRHRTAAGHLVCGRHHPDGAPTSDYIIRAHRRAVSGADSERSHPEGDTL